MRKRKYEAFTLIEMLIVMGILIILMVVGITSGRFAINRANDVAHQNAADQIYQALQAYYTDNRVFPSQADPYTLIGDVGEETAALNQYMDAGAFNGGTEATYYYFVEDVSQQSVLVCVTNGGIEDERERGLYCTGNGFGDTELDLPGGTSGADVTEKTIEVGTVVYTGIIDSSEGTQAADWYGNGWTPQDEVVE